MANMVATVSYEEIGHIKKIIVDFLTDDSAGTATVTMGRVACGRLIKIITDPGSPAPDANWDVVLTGGGVDLSLRMDDVAIAALIARHTTTTLETYLPLEDTAGTGRVGAFPVVCDALTIAVANAGNAKAGRIILYLEGMLV